MVTIAVHCNLRPPDVVPVVLGFNYVAHNQSINRWFIAFYSSSTEINSKQRAWHVQNIHTIHYKLENMAIENLYSLDKIYPV